MVNEVMEPFDGWLELTWESRPVRGGLYDFLYDGDEDEGEVWALLSVDWDGAEFFNGHAKYWRKARQIPPGVQKPIKFESWGGGEDAVHPDDIPIAIEVAQREAEKWTAEVAALEVRLALAKSL